MGFGTLTVFTDGTCAGGAAIFAGTVFSEAEGFADKYVLQFIELFAESDPPGMLS
jgi:hypothetical protein